MKANRGWAKVGAAILVVGAGISLGNGVYAANCYHTTSGQCSITQLCSRDELCGNCGAESSEEQQSQWVTRCVSSSSGKSGCTSNGYIQECIKNWGCVDDTMDCSSTYPGIKRCKRGGYHGAQVIDQTFESGNNCS